METTTMGLYRVEGLEYPLLFVTDPGANRLSNIDGHSFLICVVNCLKSLKLLYVA